MLMVTGPRWTGTVTSGGMAVAVAVGRAVSVGKGLSVCADEAVQAVKLDARVSKITIQSHTFMVVRLNMVLSQVYRFTKQRQHQLQGILNVLVVDHF